MSRNKKIILTMAICITVLIFSEIIILRESTPKEVLKVLHAGSLSVPFEEIERLFEKQRPYVDVQRESMGSVKAVRQITDIGKKVDVLAVADYTLIPDMMYTEYADWYIQFARNDVVLVYNQEKSRYADEVDSTNWYDILRRKDVTFGFSNPNLDPCGYRAVMILQLAELYYNDSKIFDDLILANTAITVNEKNGVYLIKTPEDLAPNTTKVVIRSKSVELIALIEEGGLDYAFEYRSVAVQHNLKFVSLPEKINLSKLKYSDFYGKVHLEKADGKVCIAKPVIYGITVPKNAPNPDLALEFVKLVISKEGRTILESYGQPPLIPAIGSGNIPEKLRRSVEAPTAIKSDATAYSSDTIYSPALTQYKGDGASQTIHKTLWPVKYTLGQKTFRGFSRHILPSTLTNLGMPPKILKFPIKRGDEN
ncbi:tungstate ABC transporter substrate-binding protein WtpA [Candidatus Bathyarchaeota archaeon]|nr:MAG: tungstate ABC transporter substrate-binding protein WtpA [Candidatus Bathyarchaeota archaeon]